MSGFIRFVGSALLFLFIATIFFGNDIKGFFPDDYKSYADDLINNKWLLFTLSIVLSILGTLTKVTKALKKKRQNLSSNKLNDLNYSLDKSSIIERSNSSIINRNRFKTKFVSEQYQQKGREFASKQHGKLKDIAMKVDWAPLCKGGANFKTSVIKQINSSRLEVLKSKGGLLFSGLFAVIGIGTLIFGTYFIIQDHGLGFSILGPILFGGVFAAVGIGLIIFPRPRVFDLRYGWFWSGDKSLAREQDFMKLKKSTRISEIAAIQVISEHLSGNKGGSYSSWEINLVSDDGKRLNVMDHGNKKSIDTDAQKLADFLGVPIWENN